MVPILKPPDTSDADKLAGWTDGDWTITRGSLELWRCQLSRKLRDDEITRIRDAHDAAIQDHREFLLPDFWKALETLNPPVLVVRWRCDPEHKWTRYGIALRNARAMGRSTLY